MSTTDTTRTMTPLHRLADQGQSVWLDYISRPLVDTGKLHALIERRNVSGLTSNPTIFATSIGDGRGYDDQLRELVASGTTDPDELYIELTATDIRRAADVLAAVHAGTGGRDGFVSIEVPPSVAHDTEATVAIARRLHKVVDRANVLVKVPATTEGVPAVERLIAEGINVNITLIFSLDSYRAVAEAYIRGLERRQRAGLPLAVRSVASFFVSRVDTAVDRLLESTIERDGDASPARTLLGKAAIANARLAYEIFEDVFLGDRFRALHAAGAAVQRPLWASTSAKNPAYRDVVYAEALIGPHTVDTMPEETLEAFADHGVVAGATVCEEREAAHEAMRRLAGVGVDMDAVTRRLLDDGLDVFARAYTDAVGVIGGKLEDGTAGRR